MEFSWMLDNRAVEDDEFLVRQAKKNRSAFSPLFQRYAGRVYKYIYSRVGDACVTEDLTSQVFADAISALSSYRSQGKFAGWLFTLAYRRCADYHRQPFTESLSDQILAGESLDPAAQAMQRETLQHLERLLGELAEDELELLRLHFAGRLTYPEMGVVLDRSEGAVKMAMMRLIQKMRTRWEVMDE
jgi:RNA polymerase sigma-70 factor, ECF subfamily